MKLLNWGSNTKRRHFVPVGGTSKKYWRGSRPRNPLKLLLWPFARIFSHSKSSFDDTTSPDRTALMSFEEFSDSDTDIETYTGSPLDQFPIWKDAMDDEVNAVKDINTKDEPHSTHSCGNAVTPKKRNGKKNKTLQPFKRLLAQKNDERNHGRSDDYSDNDGDSQHFSISTDFHQGKWQPKVSSCTTFDSCVTPSSANWEAECEQSRVTLEKFMESSVKDITSKFHSVKLADVAANDNASVGSAILTVSYDEQYPQLVLQPSLDGTAGSNIGGGRSAAKLGANFAHPAAARTQDPHDVPLDQLICSTEWIEDNIEKVWKQIDLDLQNEGSFDELSRTSSSTSENDPLTHWFEEALEWSQSAGDSARSLTEMIEKNVMQPIIDFVDSPQVGNNRKVQHPRLRLVPNSRRHTKRGTQRSGK